MVNIYRQLIIPILVESVVASYLLKLLRNILKKAEDNFLAKWCDHLYPTAPLKQVYTNNRWSLYFNQHTKDKTTRETIFTYDFALYLQTISVLLSLLIGIYCLVAIITFIYRKGKTNH